jgi:hypothetical protein
VDDGEPFDTSTVGFNTFQVNAQDYAGNQSTASVEYQVIWPFTGFIGLSAPPALNEAKATGTVPIRFSLGGDRGLDVLRPGYPKSRQVDCTTRGPLGSRTSASGQGPFFNSNNDQYQYGWETERSWLGTCRELELGLIDGSDRTVLFRFVSGRD